MKLYLVRHGQSEGNALCIYQDPSVGLSELGVSQSTVLAVRFRKVPVDLIMVSSYERAKQTAEIISKTVNVPVQASDLLVELKRPGVLVGRSMDEPEVMKIRESIEVNAHDPNWRYSDEETFFDFKKRAQTFLEQLKSLPKENVLVVTHGLFIKMIVCVMTHGDDLTPDLYRAFLKTFAIENTSITVCGREPGADWRVLQWNDDAHLGELT